MKSIRVKCIIAGALLALLLIPFQLAAQQRVGFNALYNFTGGTDGGSSLAGLLRDAEGNLYGTTSVGGDLDCTPAVGTGCGTVFKLDMTGKLTTLYAFTGGADGWDPVASLIQDRNGNLYGTTLKGGAFGYGTVFRVSHTGMEKVLYSFCSATNCTDGASPYANLIWDEAGCAETSFDSRHDQDNRPCAPSAGFYGTTAGGGAFGYGTVFHVSQTGTEEVLYSFCAIGLPFSCQDGSGPLGALVQDSQGNLYSTTSSGSPFGAGTVFELSKTGTETVLYSFGTNPSDGAYPVAGLVRDQAGNLYGTTSQGGSSEGCGIPDAPCGLVFKLDTNGTETTALSDLTFNGGFMGALIPDTRGHLYGTTIGPGRASFFFVYGYVFELDKNLQVISLYTICGGEFSCPVAFPYGALVQDSEGSLYGTGSLSCCDSPGGGGVFKLHFGPTD